MVWIQGTEGIWDTLEVGAESSSDGNACDVLIARGHGQATVT